MIGDIRPSMVHCPGKTRVGHPTGHHLRAHSALTP